MTATRQRIREYVAANPGVHFNALARALDIAPGQVQHHVRRLERADDIVADSKYGRTHYFEPGYDEWERSAVALLRRETARDVVTHVLAQGGADAEATADAVGIARSTLSYHVDRLTDADVVERRQTDGRVRLVPTRPAETAALLVTVDPSLRDRLVDRFTRLVDGLLAEAGEE